MASHAALLSAAVKAACQSKAPRRTVAAVAAAVTTALLQPVAAAASNAMVPERPTGALVPTDSQEDLELRLREARIAKRRAKRQRRRAKAMAAANTSEPTVDRVATALEAVATLPCEDSVPMDTSEQGKRKTVTNDDTDMTRLLSTVPGKQRPRVEVCPQFLSEMANRSSSTDAQSQSSQGAATFNTWLEVREAMGTTVRRPGQPPSSGTAGRSGRGRGPR